FAVVLREPLRLSPIRRDAPQIHLAGGNKPSHEINPLSVPGPDWIMIVETRFVFQYLKRTGASVIRDKHRVTPVRGVIDEAIPVGRPSHIPWRPLDRTAGQEHPGRAAHEGNDAQRRSDVRIVEPDLGTIAGEAHGAHQTIKVSSFALGEIDRTSGPHLADPNVQGAAAV